VLKSSLFKSLIRFSVHKAYKTESNKQRERKPSLHPSLSLYLSPSLPSPGFKIIIFEMDVSVSSGFSDPWDFAPGSNKVCILTL
jgi:hypothetical protein